MRPPPSLEISPEEQEIINRGTESESFVQNLMWLNMEKYLEGVVEEALDRMRENPSSDPQIARHLQAVWKEREAFRDRLILFVKGPIRAKKELLLEIEQQKEMEKMYGRSAY
jgi:galactokinase